MCGIRPESLVSPEQVAPFFVTGTIFLSPRPSLVCVEKFTLPYLTSLHPSHPAPSHSIARGHQHERQAREGRLVVVEQLAQPVGAPDLLQLAQPAKREEEGAAAAQIAVLLAVHVQVERTPPAVLPPTAAINDEVGATAPRLDGTAPRAAARSRAAWSSSAQPQKRTRRARSSPRAAQPRRPRRSGSTGRLIGHAKGRVADVPRTRRRSGSTGRLCSV